MSYPPPRNFSTIYLIWTGCSAAAIVLLPILLDTSHSGGAQAGMTSWAYSVPVAALGYALINVYMLLAQGPKSRNYVLANAAVLISITGLCGWSLIIHWFIITETVVQVRHEGQDEVKTEYDYYRPIHTIKAIRHYRNSYPDSIWVEYNRFGNITKRQAGESITDSTPGIYE